jgi:hypothetical protein
MISLSAYGLRGSPDPSRRGFLTAIMGAGVMLGYARSGLTAPASTSASDLFGPHLRSLLISSVKTPRALRTILSPSREPPTGTTLAHIACGRFATTWWTGHSDRDI